MFVGGAHVNVLIKLALKVLIIKLITKKREGKNETTFFY